jgi:signal transduction histidine kinase
MHPERDSANFGSWKSALHPEDRRMAEKLIETAIEKRIPLDSEYRVVLPSREVRWIKCLGNTVYDHDYQPLRMSGICLDITERKRAEEVLKRDKETFEKLVQEKMLELINARTELERARRLSDIGTLASTVAHELRNPLATIGLAALNIKKKAKNPDIEKHLNNIDAKIAESDQIINNLLFYARIKPSQFEKVDIFRLVEESAETARGNNKKKIALRKRLASIKDVAIEADRVQLAEVFSNVLNNAFDAVVDKTGKIEISAAQDKEAIEVRVGDNGCGINEDDLARIFDPFFTTKARGTGLGLSVCRQIMDFHRGTIRVESKPGQGTTVIVRLPKTHAA